MLTILYLTPSKIKRIESDTQQEVDIRNAIEPYFLLSGTQYDIMVIDLRGDVESVEFFNSEAKGRVASMGGASAWGVYRKTAEVIPDINDHFKPVMPVIQ